jgi:hypothetical protein
MVRFLRRAQDEARSAPPPRLTGEQTTFDLGGAAALVTRP